MGWLFDQHITQGARTYAPTTHQPFEQFAPQYQMDYSYAPNVQIHSPGATGSTITTKKEASSTPYIGAPEIITPTIGQETDPMGNLLILGIIAVGGAIAVSFISRKK